MTAAGLIVALVLIVAWAVILPAVSEDSPAPPVAGDSQPGSGHVTPPDGVAAVATARPGWLPVTLPALPSQPRLERPRLCAGRVARVQELITLCDPAGWPVASYAAGVRWPLAPEVALCR